jgi:sporulation protein YlmC with PRC-barrel domain
MRFKEAKNHKVVSTTDAATVAKVRAFVVDPRTASVVGLRLKKAPGPGDVIAWSDLKAFGRDAATIVSVDAIRIVDGDLAALAESDRDLLGKRVLTEGGDGLGTVNDVEFDPADGSIRAILTGTEEIAGSRMLGLGSYAVVVRN